MVQVIIDKKGNNWKAFPVLFALSAMACFVVWFGVNVPKGQHAAAQWAEEQRGTGTYAMYSDEKGGEFWKSEGKKDEKN